MSKHAAKTPRLRLGFAFLVASLLVAGNLSITSMSAKAISVDASQAAFNFKFSDNGTLISGASAEVDGAVVKFSNITDTPLAGINIDAVVTNDFTDGVVTNYDDNGNASNNLDYFQVNSDIDSAYGTVSFKFEFFEAGTYTGPGTGTPIVLQNVSVTSIDLDGSSNYCQFTDFTGFQSYALDSNTSVDVETNATNPNVPAGTTRFLATSCTNNGNRVQDAVQVKYDSVTTFTAKFGADRVASPNYFGIAFKPLSAVFGITQPAPVANPSNQPPTSTDETRYYANGEESVIQLADFGNFQDPDSNPFIKVQITALPTSGSLQKFVNGSWVNVSLNDEISATDISNGNLRFTGSVDDSLQFKVSDGIVYSTSANTLSLLAAAQSQTISFANPGTKAPTDPAFASGATASSGLPVTLTSLTPGVCTVSGTDIVPVASGSCTIVATQAGNSSFGAATPVSQTFPISTLTPQTITAANPGAQTYTGTPVTVTLAPTATSNLPVTMISLNPSVCTVSGFVVTIVGTGNCTIRNNQAGNGTYAPAPQVEFTFPVTSQQVTNYTLTYDANNGTGTVPTAQTGNGNITLAANSGNLARSGYTFGGWNTQADGNGTNYNTGATYNLTANVTLYAKWTANQAQFTLTYDANGATGSVPAAQTGNGNVTLATNSGNLSLAGFTFKGWNTQADGSGTHYNTGATYNLAANVTLFAEWEETPAVIYSPNGATSGSTPPNVPANSPITIDPNTGLLTRAGFKFVGWNTKADGTGTRYAPGENPALPAGTVLYAEWEPVDEVLAETGGTMSPVLPIAVALLGLGVILAPRRKGTKKH
ncbi:MAG: hypothetical protein RLZZ108_97 [Actinomycetota bacterium]|jgi:uncharacterized repeat protein (TIGR02543 family)